MIPLQGHLQTLFDILYSLGVIDPVLKMDWQQELNDSSYELIADEVASVCNQLQDQPDRLREELSQMDDRRLNILAMEVAREYASFHTRKTATH